MIIGTGLLGVWGLATDIANKNGEYGEDWSTGNGVYDWDDYLDHYDDYWDDLYDTWFHATSKAKKKEKKTGSNGDNDNGYGYGSRSGGGGGGGYYDDSGSVGGDPALIKGMVALSALLL